MRIDSNSLRRLASLLALGGLLTGAGMGEAKAQQDVMISQYLLNGLLIKW